MTHPPDLTRAWPHLTNTQRATILSMVATGNAKAKLTGRRTGTYNVLTRVFTPDR